MNPDRRFAVHVESNRQVAEALTEGADVLLVAHRLVKEVRRDKHEHKQRQEAVDEIHLAIETVVRPFLTTIYEKRSISGRFDPSQGRSLRYGVFVPGRVRVRCKGAHSWQFESVSMVSGGSGATSCARR